MSDSLLPISASIVASDAERTIGETVRSLDFVSEVVVILDPRSRDRTADVVRESLGSGQTLRLREETWRGHVAQKNLALETASNDWVICLDADERLSHPLREEIVELYRRDVAPPCVGYSFPRKTRCLGRWIRHGGWYPDRKLRLFRRSRGRWGGVDPHDHALVEGAVGELDGELLHEGFQSLREHIEKMDRYTRIAADEMHRRGVALPILRSCVHPPAKFLKSFVFRGGFLDGTAGLVLASLGSFYVYLKYARLWEIYLIERESRRLGVVPISLSSIEGRGR